ncbi:hypothetical protein C0039_09800 [Pseudohalioglobus lutimaris]|uniref:Uncharacterized protein n=1 Tax=Pseudohalioglobus lutimaris TaxID=1737061 RepID=A0A2N5X361_9GAMM|nr:hypothetical protein C0039_09800 [Pseudohalioglobus lutimaris]
MDFLDHGAGEPLAAFGQWLSARPRGRILLVDFELDSWWLQVTVKQSLTAIYHCDLNGSVYAAVTDRALEVEQACAAAQVEQWAQTHHLAFFKPGQPLLLQPVNIDKPWGQEIWFTGVEERGVCCFTDGQFGAPVPWVQAVMPEAAAGKPGTPLILLKILDPFPEEVRGDLYFELHEEKREVYVVTHVDESAWPSGIGGIRFGFDPAKIAQARSEEAFRQDYLSAVQQYEAVRREIDALSTETAPDPELRQREHKLRTRMDAFTRTRDLRVGDVVVVPLLMPHSLQHGVRTIEFQTPVYERRILSFAQEVLTQGHWDTAAAVARMRLLPPHETPFDELPASHGVTVERIVDFPDFEVRRFFIEAGCSEELRLSESYGLIMVVRGDLSVGDLQLGAEQAAFLPLNSVLDLKPAEPDSPLVLLLAIPCG